MRDRFIIAGAAIILGLVLVEILGRVTHYLPARPSNAYVRLSNSVGPLPIPLSRITYSYGGQYQQRLAFNKLGFRGAMTDFPTHDSRERIIVIGDSYTAAWQVPLQQRWTEVMQQIHPEWAVLNLGMPNWGTDQEYLTLLNYPLKQSPDIVLLMFYPGNDVFDNSRATLSGQAPNHPYFLPDGLDENGEISLQAVAWEYHNPFERPGQQSFPANVRTWLYLNSVNYHLASEVKKRIQEDVSGQDATSTEEIDLIPLEAGVYRIEETPEWTLAWDVTEALLLRLQAAAENEGARLGIVVVPPYGLIQETLTPVYISADPDSFDLSLPLNHMADFARAHDIELLDLTPGFQEYYQSDPNHENLFYPYDAHFTPRGNCLAAVLITRWLDQDATVTVSQCS